MALSSRTLRTGGYFAVVQESSGDWSVEQWNDWHRGCRNGTRTAASQHTSKRKASAVQQAKALARKWEATHIVSVTNGDEVDGAWWTEDYRKLYLAPAPDQHPYAGAESGTRWGVNGYANTKAEFYSAPAWGNFDTSRNRRYQSTWGTKATARSFARDLLESAPFRQVEVYRTDGTKQDSITNPLYRRTSTL